MRRIHTLIAIILFLSIPCHALSMEQVEFKQELSDAAIGSPVDVTVDAEGNIYIADREKKIIQVLDKNGKPTISWGGKAVEKTEGYRIKDPSGIAFYQDRVYVSDSGTDMVLIFSKVGKYIDGFGGGGSGPKEFSSPGGICVSRDAIYVADTGNRRIQIFSLDGIYMGSVGGSGVLDKPGDVGVDYRGYIYVADRESVKVISPQGKLQSTYYTVKEPGPIIVNKSGFYVADNSVYQVKKFDLKGNPIFSFGTEGRGKAQFKYISGISIDTNGNIFVADPKKNTVQIFYAKQLQLQIEDEPYPTSIRWVKDINEKADRILWDSDSSIAREQVILGNIKEADKIFRDSIGVLYGTFRKDNSIFVLDKGTRKTFERPQQGGWEKPGGMAIDPEGFLWVADTGNDRIIKLDKNGTIVSYIGSSGSKSGYFSDPSDIDISEKGIIYVADTGNERIQTFNLDGVFLSAIKEKAGQSLFDEPVAVALDRDTNIYVVDRKLNMVSVINPQGNFLKSFGSPGNGQGQFNEPVDIILTATEIFLLDAGNQRVQVFDLSGNYLREFGAEGKGKGDFSEPSSVTLKSSGEIFIGDPGVGRIQSFNIIYTPKNPVNLKATGDMRRITISWDEGKEEFIEHYKVYRSEDKINFKEIASSETTSFEDTSVQPDKAYYYKVSALARGGYESGTSNSADAIAIKYIPSAITWFSTSPGERDVTITWQASQEPFVTEYAVYREKNGEFVLLDRVKQTIYVDKTVKPEITYTYRIIAVSSDGVESDAATVKATTLKQTKPPMEITVNRMNNIFSNNYKLYETEPLGVITLTNNTGDEISKVKVSFVVKEFMDFPTEREVENLKPGKGMDIPINAVFNNKILDMTENTSVQAEIKVSYYDYKELQVYPMTTSLNIYEKHGLTWDVRDKIATFITPKDPILLEFSREVARQYSDINPDPLIYARAIFDAFAVIDLSYMPDPNNPYQVASATSDKVDYIQYPRETLMRKTGDCDDLVSLYSSSLESLGVHTSLLDMPGHILLMFSTGMDKSLVQADIMKDMFIIHEDYAWVPVEVTLVGSTFTTAWQKGITTYNDFKDKGLTIIDLRKAWETYKPASLPASGWRAPKVKREEIEAQFGDELTYLKNMRVRYLSRKYLDVLSKNPQDINALLQLGIIYAENSNEESIEFFKKVLSLEPQNVAAKNNLGNIYFMKGKYEEAKKYYLEASSIDPEDPYLWINLTKCYLKLNQKLEAKAAFEKAYSLNPDMVRLYQNIAFQVADPSLLILNSEEKIKETPQ